MQEEDELWAMNKVAEYVTPCRFSGRTVRVVLNSISIALLTNSRSALIDN